MNLCNVGALWEHAKLPERYQAEFWWIIGCLRQRGGSVDLKDYSWNDDIVYEKPRDLWNVLELGAGEADPISHNTVLEVISRLKSLDIVETKKAVAFLSGAKYTKVISKIPVEG